VYRHDLDFFAAPALPPSDLVHIVSDFGRMFLRWYTFFVLLVLKVADDLPKEGGIFVSQLLLLLLRHVVLTGGEGDGRTRGSFVAG
jgi:hypothetical protein